MDPDDRRRHLVRSARQVFARKGYYQTSVADLIQEAGVARGTFYNYFESKRAVFQEVLVILGEELRTAALPIDVTEPIPPQLPENVARVIRACMREASKLLFAEAVGIDAGERCPRDLRRLYGRLAGSLRLGQGLGVVGDGDMDLVAHLLIGMARVRCASPHWRAGSWTPTTWSTPCSLSCTKVCSLWSSPAAPSRPRPPLRCLLRCLDLDLLMRVPCSVRVRVSRGRLYRRRADRRRGPRCSRHPDGRDPRGADSSGPPPVGRRGCRPPSDPTGATGSKPDSASVARGKPCSASLSSADRQGA